MNSLFRKKGGILGLKKMKGCDFNFRFNYSKSVEEFII